MLLAKENNCLYWCNKHNYDEKKTKYYDRKFHVIDGYSINTFDTHLFSLFNQFIKEREGQLIENVCVDFILQNISFNLCPFSNFFSSLLPWLDEVWPSSLWCLSIINLYLSSSLFSFPINACLYLLDGLFYFLFYQIIIIDFIDQYCQGKMDCIFIVCQVNQKIITLFLIHLTRVVYTVKSDAIVPHIRSLRRRKGNNDDDDVGLNRKKKVIILFFSYSLSLSYLRKIDFLP